MPPIGMFFLGLTLTVIGGLWTQEYYVSRKRLIDVPSAGNCGLDASYNKYLLKLYRRRTCYGGLILVTGLGFITIAVLRWIS